MAPGQKHIVKQHGAIVAADVTTVLITERLA